LPSRVSGRALMRRAGPCMRTGKPAGSPRWKTASYASSVRSDASPSSVSVARAN
jgi:hypothetical protein